MQRAIDVSKWNGDIDYTGVKSVGINSVIIQCGYGMESNQKDPYFDKNYRKAKENKIEYLKAYLSSAMQVNNIDKIETVRNVIKFSKSSAVETSDNFIEWAETNAKDLLRVKTEADKIAIKSAIQEGKVPEEYAKIVEKKNLQIK